MKSREELKKEKEEFETAWEETPEELKPALNQAKILPAWLAKALFKAIMLNDSKERASAVSILVAAGISQAAVILGNLLILTHSSRTPESNEDCLKYLDKVLARMRVDAMEIRSDLLNKGEN